MSKHAIYVIPICIGLFYLGYKKIESHTEQEGINQFNKECFEALENSIGDSISIVDAGDSDDRIKFSFGFGEETDAYKAIDTASFYILTDSKEQVLFKNIEGKDRSDSTWLMYTYNGYGAQCGMHLILKESYRKMAYLLINQSDGKTYEILGYPQMSPDGTLIFSKQTESILYNENYLPGFQIWKNENGVLSLLHNIRLRSYCIVNGGWEDNKKLLVKAAPASDYILSTEQYSQCYELTLK